MVNKSQNAPHMPQAIRGKSKDQHDRGALYKGNINKRMENFGVGPTAMIERVRTPRDTKRGRKEDTSRACGGGGDGDVDMYATTAIVLSSKGKLSTATSVEYKARRKKIARASSKSEQSTYIVRS